MLLLFLLIFLILTYKLRLKRIPYFGSSLEYAYTCFANWGGRWSVHDDYYTSTSSPSDEKRCFLDPTLHLYLPDIAACYDNRVYRGAEKWEEAEKYVMNTHLPGFYVYVDDEGYVNNVRNVHEEYGDTSSESLCVEDPFDLFVVLESPSGGECVSFSAPHEID